MLTKKSWRNFWAAKKLAADEIKAALRKGTVEMKPYSGPLRQRL